MRNICRSQHFGQLEYLSVDSVGWESEDKLWPGFGGRRVSFLFVSSPDYPPSAAQYDLAKEILSRAAELCDLFVGLVTAYLEQSQDAGRLNAIEGICIGIDKVRPNAPREWDMTCCIKDGDAGGGYHVDFTEFEPGPVFGVY